MNKLNIGIAGLNFGRAIINEQIIGGYASPFFNLTAVCDIDTKKLRQAADQHKVKAYNNIDQLIADPAIDVIGLYTGPQGRADLIRKIIHANKDVVTTKPFELDPDAALKILYEAKTLNRIIHLNSPAPTYPADIKCIKNWQTEYNLGRCVSILWHTWAHYSEEPDNTWYDCPKRCPVAPLFRLGIYAISDILYFLTDPQQLYVMHSRISTKRPTPDTAQLSIGFKNGAMANIFVSFCVNDANPYPDSMTMAFERGVVYRNSGPRIGYPKTNAQLYLQTSSDKTTEPTILSKIIPHKYISGQYQWDILYKAIKGQTVKEDITPEIIAGGIRIIKAMAKSDSTGQPVFFEDVLAS